MRRRTVSRRSVRSGTRPPPFLSALACVAYLAGGGSAGGAAVGGPKTPGDPPPDPLAGYEVLVGFHRADGHGIAVVSSNGGERVLVSDATELIQAPTVSPDGTRLAYLRQRVVGTTLLQLVVVRDLATGAERTVSPANGVADLPDWSPDGSLIVFPLSRGNAPHQLTVVAPDGSGLRTLISGSLSRLSPKWSPDGRRIAFIAAPVGTWNYQIRVIGADGAGEAQLTNTPPTASGTYAASLGPSWSPDGRSLLVAPFTDGRPLISYTVADGQARPFAPAGGYSLPRWIKSLRR